MNSMKSLVLTLAATLACTFTSPAVILVNDTWADGNRTSQNPPTDSAWFTTQAALATSAVGYLSLTNRITQDTSSEWTTYFTAPGTPSRLAVGNTLTLTMEFTVNGVPSTTNTSQNLRFALCDSTSGIRLSADGQVVPTGYTGYALFANAGPAFGRVSGCFDWRYHNTVTPAGTLLGTTADWTTLGSGGSVVNSQAFTNGGNYTFTMTVFRDSETSVTLTAAYSGGGLTNALTAIDTTGVYTNFDCFQIRPSSASTTFTNLVITRFKVEGPSGVPGPPVFAIEPQSIMRVEGTYGRFNVLANGATHYQWYFTDNTFTTIPLNGATNTVLQYSHLQLAQAGQYFAIATNLQGAATSQVATLTVTLPSYTPTGVIVDDRWADGDRANLYNNISNSVWYASAAASLTATVGSMLGAADTASRLWVGYFTDEVAGPVDLDVGRAIKATLVFTPTNVTATPAGGLRVGLFSYGDGGARVFADNFGTGSAGNGTNVFGYMLIENFGTTFNDDTPMAIDVRTNIPSGSLMGTESDYFQLGSGPAGFLNDPAFISGTEYTLEFTVNRVTATTVNVQTRIFGPGLNLSFSATDTNYAYRRFDSIAVRPNSIVTSAEQFNFTRLLVEVTEAIVQFRITSFTRPDANSAVLTWESIPSKVYQVQSANTLGAAWSTNTSVTAVGTLTSYTNSGLGAVSQRYYRVVQIP
jgi:hypothetical protein